MKKIYIYGRIRMEKQLTKELKNNSESFFIIPFYYSGKKAFENYLGENWYKEQSHNYWFLAKHIDAYDKRNERIFTYYTLKAAAYQNYGLPKAGENIRIVSDLISDKLPEQYKLKISRIRILYFNTGFGFLIYQINHVEDDIETITNKSFALLHAFVENRKSGRQVKLFALMPSENSGEPEERELSILAVSNQLLTSEGRKSKIELFPISCKNQCYVYHRILLSGPVAENEENHLERDLLYLRNGFHRSFEINEEEENDIFSFSWKQGRNMYWSGSMKGVVSLSFCIPGENNYFVTEQYTKNVRNYYFLLYMILLHQRQVLLHYNYLAVKDQNDMKKLEQIKKELIRFWINFAYKTVSDEASYQKFYHGMYQCLYLDSLNSDIQDVIDRVTEYQDFANEKGMNRALALIAMFGIFSALSDGIGFADRIGQKIAFTALHWLIIAFIVVIIIFVCYTFIKTFFKK